MAGWISQTRKMISTVIASLADDLEQTVQELNDYIYQLGGTHSDGTSSSNPQTLPDNIPGFDSFHPEEQPSEKKQQLDPVVVASRPHHQLTEHLETTLTKQPETSGLPSALNSHLSYSSPTLQNSEKDPSVPEESQLMSKTAFPYMISSSSPCLIHLPGTSAEPSDRTSLIIPERDLRHPHLYCKSPESLKRTSTVGSQNVCPCHRRDSLKIIQGMKHPGRVIRSQSSIIQDQGQSHVKMDSIIASVMEDKNCSFSQRCCMQIPGQSPDEDCDSPRSDSGLKVQEPGTLQLERKPDSHQLKRDHHIHQLKMEPGSHQLKTEPGSHQLKMEPGSHQLKTEPGSHQLKTEPGSHQLKMEPGSHQLKKNPCNHQIEKELTSHPIEESSSTSMLVEHNTHFLSWASFRPFTRMLSFAIAQLANVVLLFSENSQNVHSLTSSVSLPETESKRHEVISAEYPVGTRDHEPIETYKLHFSEQDVQHLNIPQRTQSSESFEIIESSCFSGATEKDVLHQRVVSECHTGQTQPLYSDGVFCNVLEMSSSHFSSDQPNCDSDALTHGLMSSTDLVSIDFRKLLTDGHFRVDRPMLSSFSQGSTGVDSSCVGSDYEIVGESTLTHFLTGDSNNSGHHVSDRDDENEDDEDDKDSSASFIVLSDNDNNDEFIF